MKRREFIALTLSAAWWPHVAAAQPTGGIHRIGWLDYSSSAENLGIFAQAMGARGWIDGKSFRLEYRGGEGKTGRLATVAAELARLPTDVIVAPGTAEALAAKQATATIPIVMTGVDDPVALGLVASLARPGGNVTGLTSARQGQVEKLLSLLHELFPRASSVAVLLDSTDAEHGAILGYVQRAARTLGVAVNAVRVKAHTEVEPAVAAIGKQGNQVLIVPYSSTFVPGWIADLARKHALPLASTSPAYAYEGGLIAFTDDWIAVFERAAALVDRILKGAKPSDLPVELPTKFRLIVNAKTAQALKLAIPPSVMVRADSIIEG
jgi:putative ABC transport system substrate-binding protein